MFATSARRALTGLIPPKIATPGAVSSGTTSARTQAVIDFYSKLPKGPIPASERPGGIRGRYFEGANASGGRDDVPGPTHTAEISANAASKPLLATIFILFGIGYTIDYQMHLKHHKNAHH